MKSGTHLRETCIGPRIGKWRLALLLGLALPSAAHGQSSWNSHPTGTGGLLEGVDFGAGTFVAVGRAGTIVSSATGTAWSAQASGVTAGLRGIVFGGGQFVAAGEDATILTSPDGAAWTGRTTPPGISGKLLSDVCFGAGTYVAVGGEGKIIHSADAITWSEASVIPYSFFQQSTAFGDGVFISVGSNGTIMRSTDGDTWTASPSGLPFLASSLLYGVAWGDGEFIVVGAQGRILSSPDGTTWTEGVSGVNTALWGITYSRGIYVITGAEGTVLISRDGELWEPQTSGAVETLFSVVDGAGRFVAVGGRQTELDPGVPSKILSSPEAWDKGFRWSEVEFAADEDGGSAMLQLQRIGSATGVSEVSWAVTGGDATPGSDFTPASGTETFADGETVRSVIVPLLNDAEVESEEFALLTLTPVTPGWVAHDSDETRLVITDDEDRDNDGLGDAWEVTHFGSTMTHTGGEDPDLDGHDNEREQADDTDPNDPGSILYRLVLSTQGSGSLGHTPVQALYPPGMNVSLTATPDVGTTFLGWIGDLAGLNPAETIAMTGDRTITAQFGITLRAALDQPGIAWGGATFGYGWEGQSGVHFDGEDAAWVDGNALPEGELADLEAIIEGPAILRFHWRVSCAEDSDFLRFAIDGAEQTAITGEADWAQETFTLEPGFHVLNWSFERSFDFPSGTNAAWIDLVEISVPFPLWQTAYFSPEEVLDVLLSGPEEDPDGDELTNFEEYAFDLNPRLPSLRNPLPRLERLPGASTVSVVFDRPAFRIHDLTYQALLSPDLESGWTPMIVPEVILGEEGTFQRVGLAELPPGAERRFFRLEILAP